MVKPAYQIGISYNNTIFDFDSVGKRNENEMIIMS